MDRRTLPLLLASAQFMSEDETQPLDRIRMQKGVFLLEKRGPGAWRELYPFRPYDWGPFSRELVNDIDAMLGDELTIVTFEGFRFGEYRTTAAGEHVIAHVVELMPDAARTFVRDVRRFVTRRSFSELLREVYEAFPDYATRSRFVG